MTRFAGILERLRGRGSAAFVCQAAGLALVFIAQVAVARVLGASSYGIYAYAMAWTGALGIAARWGLDTVVLRDAGVLAFRDDLPALRNLVQAAGRHTLWAGGILALGVAFVAGALTIDGEIRGAFWLGVLLLPIAAFSSVRQSALLALDRPWAALAPEYVLRPVILGVLVLIGGATLAQVDAREACVATVMAASISCLLGQMLLSRSLGTVERSTPRAPTPQLWRSGSTLLLLSGSSQLLYQVDTIMVGTLIRPEATGSYYAAKQMALVTSLALIALQTTAAPRMAALYREGDRRQLQRLLTKIGARGMVFAGAYLLLMAVAGPLVLRMFGPGFGDAYPVLLLLALGQFVGAAGGASGQLAAMSGMQTFAGGLYLSATLLYVAVALVVIPKYGVIGASIVVVAIALVCAGVLNGVLWRRRGVFASPLFASLPHPKH